MNITPGEFADLLVQAAFRPRSYSGRGMYGDRCVSVTVEPRRALAIGSALAMVAHSAYSYAGCELGEALEILHDRMTQARQDDMGRTQVVVYWPMLPWPTGRSEP